MKKKPLAFIIAVSLLLSACNSDTGGNDNTGSQSTAPMANEETTSARISAVEDQPENTSPTSDAGEDIPEETTPAPDGFPAPYPMGAVIDDEMLSEFKEIIQAAETANSVLYGKHTIIPLKGEESNGYKLISPDYAVDLNELTTRMYEGFKYSFWEDKYGDEVENMLPDIVLETDSGIMMSVSEKTAPVVVDVSSAVLTSLGEINATVTALGVQGDKYVWRTYDMLNGVRGWVVRMYSDENVTGEIAVFSQLLIDKSFTLDKIFGNAKRVTDENGDWNTQLVTIENDVYGHGFYNGLEIEPFMTVEEMRQFMRDTFTSEIAESYIRLYINRTYVEKDGRLYIINGSILPQTGSFSLANYENRAISSFDVTSAVEWTDGENTYTVPVTIAYEDGLWKLDTRLPMREDRVIGK